MNKVNEYTIEPGDKLKGTDFNNADLTNVTLTTDTILNSTIFDKEVEEKVVEEEPKSETKESNEYVVELDDKEKDEEHSELEESSSSGGVFVTNSGEHHNNILSNFSGSINTNGGDVIVNFNGKEETSLVEEKEDEEIEKEDDAEEDDAHADAVLVEEVAKVVAEANAAESMNEAIDILVSARETLGEDATILINKAFKTLNPNLPNKDEIIKSEVNELNELLTGMFPKLMSDHNLILVADTESVKQDLLQLENGQKMVDRVFANNTPAFLHLAEDTENKGWNTNTYDEIVILAENGNSNAIRALELIQKLNKETSHIEARDDLGDKLINYSNAEEGIFNGLNIDIGVHNLGLFRANKLMDLMKQVGYGNHTWYCLEVYDYEENIKSGAINSDGGVKLNESMISRDTVTFVPSNHDTVYDFIKAIENIIAHNNLLTKVTELNNVITQLNNNSLLEIMDIIKALIAPASVMYTKTGKTVSTEYIEEITIEINELQIILNNDNVQEVEKSVTKLGELLVLSTGYTYNELLEGTNGWLNEGVFFIPFPFVDSVNKHLESFVVDIEDSTIKESATIYMQLDINVLEQFWSGAIQNNLSLPAEVYQLYFKLHSCIIL